MSSIHLNLLLKMKIGFPTFHQNSVPCVKYVVPKVQVVVENVRLLSTAVMNIR